MSKNQKVNIKSHLLNLEVIEVLPKAIFWNSGRVIQVIGDRVQVRWNKEDKYWFDSDQLIKA